MLFDEMEFNGFETAERKARRAYELYEDGDIAQAITELDEAIDHNPANSSWHFNKALALDVMSRFEEAITEYKIALDLNPVDTETLNCLAVDYTRAGYYDLALETFDRLQQLDPMYEPGYCNRIITYTEMGIHEKAEEMFYLAQQIDSDCALCYYNIGNSLFVRAMYKKAISCWLRTAELEPTHPQINFRIAQAYWSDGDLKAARRYFLTELRGNPGDIDVILDFGLFLLEAGEIDSAKEKFHRILELKEDFAPAIFYLGEIAQADGEEALALELYAEAMEVDLENPPLAGPRFRLGQLALKAGKKKLARSYLVSELDLVADDADVLVSLGSMFLELDEFDYARHCLERAVEINCANAEGYYYLGLLKMKQFNFEAAADFLAHALDIHPAHIGALQASIKTSLELGRLDIASSRIARADMLQEPPQCLNRLKWQIRFARCAQKFQEVVNPSRN